jgi:hypothetical protein
MKAKELGSPLSRGASVVGGAILLAGAGPAKDFVGGGEEAEEGGGASGTGEEGLGVGGVVALAFTFVPAAVKNGRALRRGRYSTYFVCTYLQYLCRAPKTPHTGRVKSNYLL